VWPLDRFASLARQLRSSLDAAIVLVGGKAEAAGAQTLASSLGDSVVAAAGRTSLIQSAAIAARATVFVGNDSGPAHVAAGVGCPAGVLFFGLADPQRIRPVGRSVTILQPGHPCDPRCTEEACACPETHCMLKHTVDRVASAAEAAARTSAGRS
jgi:ADP-heptose:LPS heptosyltransferase